MRRRGRVCALQILYQLDLAKELDDEERTTRTINAAIQRYWGSFDAVSPEDQRFAERIVHGVARDLEAIDAALAAVSHHWKVARMDKVDRNLLRLAAYEILRCPDIPRAASINEAIEIAKRFSGNESAAFINGILDRLAKENEAGDAGAGIESTEG
jgi:N utilization substance protein B